MSTNGGLLIGGPRAGQWLVAEGPTLIVCESFGESLRPYGGKLPSPSLELRQHAYAWRPFRLGEKETWFWVSTDLRSDGEVWRELVNGYRPVVVPKGQEFRA